MESMTKCKKPDMAGLQQLVNPVGTEIQAADKLTQVSPPVKQSAVIGQLVKSTTAFWWSASGGLHALSISALSIAVRPSVPFSPDGSLMLCMFLSYCIPLRRSARLQHSTAMSTCRV